MFAPFVLELPSVQTNYVSIAGLDGALDLTESLGTISYNNRKIMLDFTHKGSINDSSYIHSQISSFLHGQKLKIILPN